MWCLPSPKSMVQRTKEGTAYDVCGPADAPVLVLIHGLGVTREMWEAHLPAFSAEHRVLRYDLAGHGESAAPVEAPSLTLYSEQLRVLLDELAIAAADIVGFSLGGMINRRFAMDYGPGVKRLVILNSPHERGAEAQRLVEERATDSAAGGPTANLEVTLARWFTPRFLASRPEVIEQMKAWVLANDARLYAQARWVLARGVVELIRPEQPIRKTCLVMTCEHDSGSTPAMTWAIASEIPGADWQIVPDLQHCGLLEDPEVFTTPILAFLGREETA